MASFRIEGGHLLRGTITPQGAKNEALQVICASLLTSDRVTIYNVPDIRDVNNLILLLKEIGRLIAVDVFAVSHFPQRLAVIFRDFPEDDAFAFQIRDLVKQFLHRRIPLYSARPGQACRLYSALTTPSP